MADTTNLGSVRAWLRTCPAVASMRWGADYLADDPDKFALLTIPSTLRRRQNIIGEDRLLPKQEQSFAIDYRATYGSEVQQNLDNLGMLQQIIEWITEQNNASNYPDWHGGTVEAVAVPLTPILMEATPSTARYRLQIKVIYTIH